MRVSKIPQGKLMESKTQTQMLFDLLNDTFNFFGDVDIFGDTLSQINDFWANYFKDIEDSQITEFNLDIVKKSIFDSLVSYSAKNHSKALTAWTILIDKFSSIVLEHEYNARSKLIQDGYSPSTNCCLEMQPRSQCITEDIPKHDPYNHIDRATMALLPDLRTIPSPKSAQSLPFALSNAPAAAASFMDVVMAATQSAAAGSASAAGHLPGILTRRSSERWTAASSRLARSQAAYFRAFVPRAALAGCAAPPGGGPLAVRHDAAVLLVDISGFTRLCDRFQALGEAGIDAFTAIINRVFAALLARIDAHGGEVVKFDGDALIVAWLAGPGCGGLATAVALAVRCALELERRHGTFAVQVPAPGGLPAVDELNRSLTAAASAGPPPPAGAAATAAQQPTPLQELEMARVLSESADLGRCLRRSESAQLAKGCELVTFRDGQALVAAGEPGAALLVIHSGSARRVGPGRAGPGRAEEDVVYREGDVVGAEAALAGGWQAASVVASGSCSAVRVPRAAVRALSDGGARLAAELPALLQARDFAAAAGVGGSVVTLRLHQASLIQACPQSHAHRLLHESLCTDSGVVRA